MLTPEEGIEAVGNEVFTCATELDMGRGTARLVRLEGKCAAVENTLFVLIRKPVVTDCKLPVEIV